MESNFTHLIQALSEMGLTGPASELRSIKAFLRLASSEFSKEQEVLRFLARLSKHLQQYDLHDRIEEDLYLPAFSLTINRKVYTKPQESLKNYTKQDIFLGIQNYLASFIKHYMKPKTEIIPYNQKDGYKKVIDFLEDSLNHLATTNKTMTRGVSKESVKSALNRTLRTAGMISLYLTILKKDLPRVKSTDRPITKQEQEWLRIRGEDLPYFPESDEDFSVQTWAQKLTSLEFNPSKEMTRMEQRFAEEQGLKSETLNYIIRSFRPSTRTMEQMIDAFGKNPIQASLHRTATDDDDDEFEFLTPPKLEDIQKKPEKKDEPSRRFWIKDKNKKPEPLDPVEKAKNDQAAEKAKDDLAHLRIWKEYQARENEPDKEDYKELVHSIISHSSILLPSKDGKKTPVSSVRLYRAYRDYLVPTFQTQYRALLQHGLNVYIGMYQVQSTQDSISDYFARAAAELEDLE